MSQQREMFPGATVNGVLPPRAGTMKAKMLEALRHRAARGATCDELELQLGAIHQSLSARMLELRQDGLVVTFGEHRNTRSGRPAIVWLHPAVTTHDR